MNLWKDILVKDLEASEAGRHVLQEGKIQPWRRSSRTRSGQNHPLRCYFVDKQPQTLNNFSKWLEGKNYDKQLDIKESDAYEYIKALVENKAAPTVPSSFKASLSFAGGLLDLQGALDAAGSGRVQGLVVQQLFGDPRSNRHEPSQWTR